MFDLTPDRRPRNRARAAYRKTTVTATLPAPIADLLDSTADRLQTNRNRLIAAALEVDIPLVEAQVRAASAGRQQ